MLSCLSEARVGDTVCVMGKDEGTCRMMLPTVGLHRSPLISYIQPLISCSWKAAFILLYKVPCLGRGQCQPRPVTSTIVWALVMPGPEALLFSVTHKVSSW